MEVHAHTHTPRRKWTHYFREFFIPLFTTYELPLASASGLNNSKL